MEEVLSLNGTWALWFGPDEGPSPVSGAQAAQRGFRRIEATVPGNVELDLVAAGLERDPLTGSNVLSFERYEQYAWVFEREFTSGPALTGRRAALRLHGVNTYSDVYINGVRVGETDNMLIAHEFDITEHLYTDKVNTITVSIRSAMKEARKKPLPVAQQGTGNCNEIPVLRMPPHSFGWDIMPRLLSAGLWRDVEIAYQGPERFRDVYMYTRSADADRAHLALCYTFESDREILPIYTVRVEGRCGDSVFSACAETHFVSNSLQISVQNPQLWWPRGYGDAPLYDVSVTLMRDGEACDVRRFRFGIRTATVDACFEKDKGRFSVVVNGERIFIRGSNWVPLSALHSLDISRVGQAISMLTACGANAVRCWGGNVYESDAFYDLCDENGLLVWQDFAMACVIPPQDDAFAAAIEREAAFIVRRLRNHACLLLWAGDNEIDQAYAGRYPQGHARYNRITREVLPWVCAAHDPMRYYLPSSPYIPEHESADLKGPEQHLWGPRDDFKGDFYRLNTARFASEIGYHGCPAVSSLRRFLSPGELWPMEGSLEWLVHNTEHPRYRRGYDRNELMTKQAAMLFGEAPGELADFAFASQYSQAEAKKFFIEQFRMKKWDKTGILWWNLLDGWPQISDAVVDYYFHAKLAYHIISRSQRPVQLMMDEYRNWGHDVWAVNDTLCEVAVTCRVTDGATGETLMEKRCVIPRNGIVKVGQIRTNPAHKRLFILTGTANGETFHNHYAAGRAPFTLHEARRFVDIISALEPRFDAEGCWR